jgi:hypothetical protein
VIVTQVTTTEQTSPTTGTTQSTTETQTSGVTQPPTSVQSTTETTSPETTGLVVLTDNVVGPWVDVVTSVPVVVVLGGSFGVVLELTVVVPIYTIQLKFVRRLKRT